MSIKINTAYISTQNSYDNQTPKWIVIHNTDNFNAGAGAKNHASAQKNGNFDRYSAHVFVDDHSAYQATSYYRGAWHIGVNYGGRLFGIANNRNAVGIEMCVNPDCDYEKAFLNTVDVCKQIMRQLKIDADHVIQHYDACAKNCPSVIRKKGDWARFKKLISESGAPSTTTPATTPTTSQLYRVRKTWADAKSQTGAYRILENAKANCPEGYSVFDSTGKRAYTHKKKTADDGSFQVQVTSKYLRIRKAASINAAVLGYTGRGIFTITKTSGDWGYLKSGAGWINIKTDCVKRL